MADQARPLGFWLRLLDGLIEDQFAALIEEHGLTRRQWQLLTLLREGPASLQQLDDSLQPFLDATVAESAVDQLDELVESSWVVRTDDGYALTERGHESFERVREVVSGTRDKVADGVTAQEYDQTLAVLERMARNLGWQG